MRGKRPKERRCYVLRTSDGTIVEVTREVYLEWYQSRRRERYQKEQERKYQVSSLEMLAEQGNILIGDSDGVEDMVIREMCAEKLRSVMKELEEEDVYLLYLLFFAEVTVKEAAQICGCNRKTIANRRKRILAKLKEKLKAIGMIGGCF